MYDPNLLVALILALICWATEMYGSMTLICWATGMYDPNLLDRAKNGPNLLGYRNVW